MTSIVEQSLTLALEKLGNAHEAVEQMQIDARRFVALRAERHDIYSPSMQATSMAAHVQGIYTHLESILKSVLLVIDGDTPTGEAWHRALLRQASCAVAGERARLISEETFALLDHLLGFRHVVRVHYGGKLRPHDVFLNVERTVAVVPAFEQDLREFREGLPRA